MSKSMAFCLISMFAVLLCGCERDDKEKLQILECFADVSPDSAYSQLVRMEQESRSFSERDRMRYRLLRLKCQNSLDIPFDTIPVASQVASYYERHGDDNARLLSRYLHGRAYHVQGDELMAMECYDRCLECVDTLSPGLDYIQLSKVYSQRASIFHDQLLAQEELESLRNAERCALQGGDSLLALIYFDHMVGPCSAMNDYEGEIAISKEASRRYRDMGMEQEAAQMCADAVYPYVMLGRYEEAGQCIRTVEEKSGWFDENGNIELGREVFYYKKGLYHLGIHQMDSAEQCFRRLMNFGEDVNNLECAYSGLLSLYRQRGVPDSIGKYAELYVEVNDSVHNRRITGDIIRNEAVYRYTSYKDSAMRNAKEKVQYKVRTSIIATVCFLVLGILLVSLYRRKEAHRKEIIDLLDERERTVVLLQELSEDKAAIVEKHQRELQEIESALQMRGYKLLGQTGGSNVDAKLVSKFSLIGKKGGNDKCFLAEEDWQALQTEMEIHESGFMLFLRKSGLSESETKIAMLVRLGFTDYDIKNIIASYGSALSNYKAKINRKLFNHKGGRTMRPSILSWKK